MQYAVNFISETSQITLWLNFDILNHMTKILDDASSNAAFLISLFTYTLTLGSWLLKKKQNNSVSVFRQF